MFFQHLISPLNLYGIQEQVRFLLCKFLFYLAIYSIIQKKSNWIKKKLLEIHLLEKKKREFQELKFIMFKGKKIILNFQEGKEDKVTLLNNNLKVVTKIISHKKKKTIIFSWLKKEASKYLLYRLNFFSKKYLIKFKSLEVKNFKARWGSCNTNLDIQLNWKLIMLPSRIIDYVVIHELCHIKVPNHSKSFWSHVSLMDPLYKEKSKWLKKNRNIYLKIRLKKRSRNRLFLDLN